MIQQGFITAQKPSQSATSTSSGLLQRKCDKCRKKKPLIQRSAVGSAPHTVPHMMHEVLTSPRSQDATEQPLMEPRFGHDFSRIPLHSGSMVNIQAKLAVNAPGDIFEQEADRIADEVMRVPMGAQSDLQQHPMVANRVGTAPGSVQREPQSPDQEGDCSGWEKDCESFCRRAARQYWIDIGVSPPPVPEGKVECERPFIGPEGQLWAGMCHLNYKNGTMVTVGRSIHGGKNIEVWQTKPNDKTNKNEYSGPVCDYGYYCTKKQSTLILEKKFCYDPRTEKRPEETEKESSQPSLIQRSATSELAVQQMPVPPMVHDVLNSPGKPLDPATSSFMENRFGHDFSQVRVHTDSLAAQSASLINAHAYTAGSHIIFAESQFNPARPEGRRLLAHELAHVVQQRDTTASTHSGLMVGSATDGAEQEADSFAHAALLAGSMSKRSAMPAISHLSGPSISHSVIRRAPKDASCPDEKNKTWAGCFDTEWYSPTRKEDGKDVRYGADIQIRFNPNDNVDAEKIALSQTAQSSLEGQPVSIYFKDEKTDDISNPDIEPRIRGVADRKTSQKRKDTALSRMIDILDPAAGTAIDSLPESRTPLAGMSDPVKGNELSGSVPTKFGKFGCHTKQKDKHGMAIIRDIPGLIMQKQVEAHQIFETTALAVAGVQKGTFYGSVQWGWKKSSSDDKATLIPFRLKREATPSPDFEAAAKLYNASKTSNDEASIGLPLTAEMFTTPKKAALMDSPDKKKSSANLDTDTRVEVMDTIDDKHKDWRNVVVVSGPSAGKVGWIKLESLSDRPTTKPAKK